MNVGEYIIDLSSKSKKWEELESFVKSAQKFGSTAFVTMGFGGSTASTNARKSTLSLLYIKMVAVFSDELKEYCNGKKIDTSDDRLAILLREVEKAKIIDLDFSELRRIREKRNEISHKPPFLIEKEEFEADKEIIKAELEKFYV